MYNLHPIKLIKKIMPTNGRADGTRKVSIGDRFERDDAAISIWVVERISNVRASRFPLISLSREGRPDITKTVSLDAFVKDGGYHTAV